MFFWGKTAIGLDIDDRSIEAAEVKRQGKKIKIVSLGRTVLDKGIVENGRIKQFGPLVSAVRETLAKARPSGINGRNLVFGLPANQTYTAIVELPQGINGSKEMALKSEARRLIPLEDDDLFTIYRKLGEEERYLLLGVSKSVAKEWQELGRRLKREPSELDLEVFSLFRDLELADAESPTILADIGSTVTNILVYDHNAIQYSASLKLAGDDFSQAIASHFELDFNIAEVKKVRLGLNRQLFPVLSPLLDEIALEITKVFEYYKRETGRAAAEVLLLGGSSRLKGLPLYMGDRLPTSVRLAQTKLSPSEYPEHIGAIGFALKRLFKDRWTNEPVINLDNLGRKWSSGTVRKLSPTKIKNMPEPSAPIYRDNAEAAKLAREKKLLILILICAAPLLAGAFWYRQDARAKHQEVLQAARQGVLNYQTFPYRLAVKLDGATDGVPGRVAETKVKNNGDFLVAQAEGAQQALTGLQAGEALWPQPLNEIVNKTQPELTFRWLIFSDKKALEMAMKAVTEQNSDKSDIIFSTWSKDKLEKTDNPALVYLNGAITLSSAKTLAAPNIAPAASSSTEAISESAETGTSTPTDNSDATVVDETPSAPVLTVGQKATVGSTETGWLNVRSGPGAGNELITKINPGEQYEVLSVEKDWVKIKLDDSRSGWVKGSYLK